MVFETDKKFYPNEIPADLEPTPAQHLTGWLVARSQDEYGVWFRESVLFDHGEEIYETLVELSLPEIAWHRDDFMVGVGPERVLIGLCRFANDKRAPGSCLQRIWIRAKESLAKQLGNNFDIYIWSDDRFGPWFVKNVDRSSGATKGVPDAL